MLYQNDFETATEMHKIGFISLAFFDYKYKFIPQDFQI